MVGYKDSWHNTTDERNMEELNVRAESQEDKVLDYFRRNPDRTFTPFHIQKAVLPDSPITSVRRAMTNLTKAGRLIKLTVKVKEKYGVSNYKWKYNGYEHQMNLF